MDKNKIYNMFKTFDSHTDDYLGAMFINIFSELPMCYRYYYDNDCNLNYQRSEKTLNRSKFKYKIDSRKFLQNLLKNKKSFEDSNMCYEVFTYSSNEFLICGEYPAPFMLNITMSIDSDASDTYDNFYTLEDNVKEVFEKIIKPNCVILENDNKLEFGIASVMEGTSNLYTTWYDYDINIDVNIENNYNNDLPYDKICDILGNDKRPDLMLFYGEPGTGKTTLIKHLIKKFINKSFIFIDGSLLATIQQDKLMSYFLDNWDTIFILEDCEKILTDRESGYNPVMPVLLNITDGIVGDVLKTKFICTFNSSLAKIDKALLRKGRLSLKYEFKKLSKDKVKNILPSENRDMTLADIYYNEDENDYSKTQKNKIGF